MNILEMISLMMIERRGSQAAAWPGMDGRGVLR